VALVINGKRYRFTELEFYFTCKTHDDPFTHCVEVQYTLANWYFHRSGKSYKAGSYKGLDISIGNSEHEAGGILIRSIESLDGTASVICGPSLTVDHILKLCSASGVKEFVEDSLKKKLSIAKEDGRPLYVVHDPTLPQREVFKSGRVGLHMTKQSASASLQQQYVFKLYRFLTNPKLIPKGRNLMILGLLHKGVPNKNEITHKLGTTAALTEKTTTLFEKGKKSSIDNFMGRRLSDDEVSEAFGCLDHLIT